MNIQRLKSIKSVSKVSAAWLLISFGALIFCFFTQSLMVTVLILGAVLPWIGINLRMRGEFVKRVHELQHLSEMNGRNQWAEVSRQLVEDIRSPLMALTTLSHLSHEMNNDKKELLQVAVTRIRGVVDDFFKNSLVAVASERLPMPLGTSSSELISVLNPLLKEYQFSHPQTHWALHNHLTSSNALVDMDTIQLQRILSHLLNNALEAVPENEATIEVTLMERSDHFLLQIMDNGCGIPEDILPKLAQPGVSHGKEKGHGLGLFEARKTLEALGGELQIRSREGVGTQVILLFPKKVNSQEVQVM